MIPKFHGAGRAIGPLEAHAGSVLHTFEMDTTGRNAYRINAWGYRGEDWNHAARRRIFVFGCSYTFGTGLREDEIWCAHLKGAYAEAFGVRPEEINLLNFGVTGASNSEIARLACLQCSVAKPDLALFMFTHPDRGERLLPEGVFNIGPWSPNADYLTETQREMAADFYRCYHESDGALDLVKHMYFSQRVMAAAGIEFITAASVLPREFPEPARRFLRLLDGRRTIWLPAEVRRMIERNEFYWTGEKASDEIHFGPGLHQVAGEIVARLYRRLHYGDGKCSDATGTVGNA